MSNFVIVHLQNSIAKAVETATHTVDRPPGRCQHGVQKRVEVHWHIDVTSDRLNLLLYVHTFGKELHFTGYRRDLAPVEDAVAVAVEPIEGVPQSLPVTVLLRANAHGHELSKVQSAAGI